jgi:hypothetical protein
MLHRHNRAGRWLAGPADRRRCHPPLGIGCFSGPSSWRRNSHDAAAGVPAERSATLRARRLLTDQTSPRGVTAMCQAVGLVGAATSVRHRPLAATEWGSRRAASVLEADLSGIAVLQHRRACPAVAHLLDEPGALTGDSRGATAARPVTTIRSAGVARGANGGTDALTTLAGFAAGTDAA